MDADDVFGFVIRTIVAGVCTVGFIEFASVIGYNMWLDAYGEELSLVGSTILGIVLIVGTWIVGIIVWYGIPIVADRIEAWTGFESR